MDNNLYEFMIFNCINIIIIIILSWIMLSKLRNLQVLNKLKFSSAKTLLSRA
jgi:hypothetical protein